jgi:ribonucleoside-diphosphate reductase beta chain
VVSARRNSALRGRDLAVPEWLREHPEIDRAQLNRDILGICDTIIEHEDAFIDLAFELGDVQGLTAADVKRYLRYIANRRIAQLGMPSHYYPGVEKNPLPWLDEILNGVEHVNFFEQRATEYSKAAASGSWENVWDEVDAKKAFLQQQPNSH